jgi:hypothetical protein
VGGRKKNCRRRRRKRNCEREGKGIFEEGKRNRKRVGERSEGSDGEEGRGRLKADIGDNC